MSFEAERLEWVTNGCADDMSGTPEVAKLADPLCSTRKSAEVGQLRTIVETMRAKKMIGNLLL
jgi:hypothetical protein